MALFSRNKPTEESAKKTAATPAAANTAQATDRDLSSVIVKPRITEKAVSRNGQNVYTFVVRKEATKYDVRDAIKQLYTVTPVKVNIVNKSTRQFMSRSKGRNITQSGMKKAYVYLKSGDNISVV